MDTTPEPPRIYQNTGNRPLLELLSDGCRRILDVGCGAGDNAARLRADRPDVRVHGLTHTEAEAQLAGRHMERCWVCDIEGDLPEELGDEPFDAIIFSHVLEHLREPAVVLERFLAHLRPGGEVVIAVPNVLFWRDRFRFLMGHFEYEAAGTLDETHLRFFSYHSADRYLLSRASALTLVHKGASGSVPLWWLRRHVLPRSWSERIDEWACRRYPNMFGSQVLIKALKK